jgi:hypothetical protein
LLASLVFVEQDTIGLHPLCTDVGTSAWPRRADSFMVGLAQGGPPEVPKPPAAAPEGFEKEIEKLL